MIKPFICRECRAENKFETEGSRMFLTDAVQVDRHNIYIISCNNCGKENSVKVTWDELNANIENNDSSEGGD